MTESELFGEAAAVGLFADPLHEWLGIHADGPRALRRISSALLDALAARGLRVGLLAEPVALCPWATVQANAGFALRLSAAGRAGVVLGLLSEFGLDKMRNSRPQALSALCVKKLGLAMASAVAPDAYVLENATSGLDKAEAAELAALARNSLRAPAVLVTDSLDEIEAMCAWLAVPGASVRLVRCADVLLQRPSLQEYVESLRGNGTIINGTIINGRD